MKAPATQGKLCKSGWGSETGGKPLVASATGVYGLASITGL